MISYRPPLLKSGAPGEDNQIFDSSYNEAATREFYLVSLFEIDNFVKQRWPISSAYIAAREGRAILDHI